MKCFKCGRTLQSNTKHFYINGKPIGPTCYANIGQKTKIMPSKAVINDQPDFFKEMK